MRGVVTEGTGAAIRRRYGITAGRGRQDRHHAGEHRRLVHPDASAACGGRAGGLQRQADDGILGPGRPQRAAMVGEVFQQALRKGWIDQRAEFAIPRPRPRPPPEPEPQRPRREEVFNNVVEELRRIFGSAM